MTAAELLSRVFPSDDDAVRENARDERRLSPARRLEISSALFRAAADFARLRSEPLYGPLDAESERAEIEPLLRLVPKATLPDAG